MRFAPIAACLLSLFVIDRAYGQEKYLLQPGDSLEIWVAQEEDLRRSVVVEPDGWVSFPLAGHLQAAGLSVVEVEAALGEKLRPFFKENPNLTIMLRPDPLHQPKLFIAGEVTTPGSYSYQQGMTVLHAVSVAGGLRRKDLLAADQDRSVIVRRTVEASQAKLKQLAARRARLEAELNGASTIAVSGEDRDVDMVAQEQSILDTYRRGVADQDTARRDTVNLGTQNVDEIRNQIDINSRRLELAKQRRDTTVALVEKGALQAGQRFDREGEVATLEATASQLQAQVFAVQRTLQSDLALIDNAQQARKEKVLAEVVDLEREQQTTRDSLSDALNVLAIYQSTEATRRPSQMKISYRIVRSSNGEPHEFDATEMTPLRPGDLVRVVADPAGFEAKERSAEVSLQAPSGLQPAPLAGN